MTWYDYGAIPPISDIGTVTCSFNSQGDWAHTIATLTLFNGKLFMSYGDYSCNVPTDSDPAYLVAWDIATGSVVNYGQLNSNSFHDMQVVNGELAITYTDPAIGSYPCVAFMDTSGTITVVDGGIRAWHIYGATYFGGKRYVSGAWLDPVTSGNPNAHAVWRDDGGSIGWMRWDNGNPTFEPNSYLGTQRSTSAAYRVFGLFVLGSTLYASFGGGTLNTAVLKTTTGDLGSWTSTGSGPSRMKRPMVIGSEAFYGAGDPGLAASILAKHNGTSQTTIVSGASVWDHTVGTDGNLYYLDTSMNIKNVSGTNQETAPTNSRSIAYVDGVWYAGTKDSHLWATTPAPKIVVDGSGSFVVDGSGNYVSYT